MPQIGWFEILVVALIAILVIGPKEFPIVLRKVGSWVSSVKRYYSEMQSNIHDITNIEPEKKKSNEIESDEQKK